MRASHGAADYRQTMYDITSCLTFLQALHVTNWYSGRQHIILNRNMMTYDYILANDPYAPLSPFIYAFKATPVALQHCFWQ